MTFYLLSQDLDCNIEFLPGTTNVDSRLKVVIPPARMVESPHVLKASSGLHKPLKTLSHDACRIIRYDVRVMVLLLSQHPKLFIHWIGNQ